MRFFRSIVVILAIPSLIGAILLLIFGWGDVQAPTITCDQKEDLEVLSTVTDEELLSHVTAYDSKDGDLTDKVVLERKTYLVQYGKSIVTFSVCDSDNNVSSIRKNIVFTDYHSPRLKLKSDLIIHRGETVEIGNQVTVSDVFDGDISNRLKMISSTYNYLVAGKYLLNCKATNRYGDVLDLDLNVYVVDEDFSRSTIRLKDYLLYVKRGDTLDYAANIDSVINKVGYYYREDQVEIDSGNCNLSKAGVYDVFYTIKNGNDTVTKTRLVVVVEE